MELKLKNKAESSEILFIRTHIRARSVVPIHEAASKTVDDELKEAVEEGIAEKASEDFNKSDCARTLWRYYRKKKHYFSRDFKSYRRHIHESVQPMRLLSGKEAAAKVKKAKVNGDDQKTGKNVAKKAETDKVEGATKTEKKKAEKEQKPKSKDVKFDLNKAGPVIDEAKLKRIEDELVSLCNYVQELKSAPKESLHLSHFVGIIWRINDIRCAFQELRELAQNNQDFSEPELEQTKSGGDMKDSSATRCCGCSRCCKKAAPPEPTCDPECEPDSASACESENKIAPHAELPSICVCEGTQVSDSLDNSLTLESAKDLYLKLCRHVDGEEKRSNNDSKVNVKTSKDSAKRSNSDSKKSLKKSSSTCVPAAHDGCYCIKTPVPKDKMKSSTSLVKSSKEGSRTSKDNTSDGLPEIKVITDPQTEIEDCSAPSKKDLKNAKSKSSSKSNSSKPPKKEKKSSTSNVNSNIHDFCYQRFGDRVPLIKKNLLGAIKKIVGKRTETVFLKFSLLDDDVVHVMILTSTEPNLGCLYTTEAAALEAKNDANFKKYVSFCITKSSTFLQEVKCMVNFPFELVDR